MSRILQRKLPAGLDALTSLALDLRWTWSHAGDALWRMIDPSAWEQTQNPWFVLNEVPQRRLEALAEDGAFRAELERLTKTREAYLTGPSWFSANGARLKNERIAYFSMEFGLGEAIPLYAGGLGILAGDYLKTASDLGIPIVGVGILFQVGYFRQAIDSSGGQREFYPYNDPATLPIQPVASSSGGSLRVPIELPGRTLWLRVWRANVGRVDLYLLDGNDELNTPVDRGITAKLYGDGLETRLVQEIVLGVGGWRTLEALGLEPSVAHLNEGHAAFVVLERARRFREKHRLSFSEALWATRAANVFTTHTPVAAGFDAFPGELLQRYFSPLGYPQELGISSQELFALGRRDAADAREPFNMAYLAMRGCARANGVSRVHGAVSRRLFADLFPRWPESEVPVDYVTNGVHIPTWDSAEADALWTGACGKDRWGGSADRLGGRVATLSDAELWNMRIEERAKLVAYARNRLALQLVARGAAPGSAASTAAILGPGILTVGFARRFAEYKRPDMLLRDPERLVRLLRDPVRPLQLVIAGKAHPADEAGKRMIAEWIAFVNRAEVRHRAVFLEDYDMAVAARLVTGVDVWVNTPRRPWEACGTSGMKVLANGGLNVSELDGWWAEAYKPQLGWALGTGDGPADDARDAGDLVALLEREVVPEFYDRDEQGVPRRWLARVRASMAELTPAFSSNRMALEYAGRFYSDAAERYYRRAAGNGQAATSLARWEAKLTAHWADVRIGAIQSIVQGPIIEYRVEVHLGSLTNEDVRVELFADPRGSLPRLCLRMREVPDAHGPPGHYLFATSVTTERPAQDFTPRVVPFHAEAVVPNEAPLVVWPR